MAKILVTGCAGFIGFHLCRRLIKSCAQDDQIVGLDNLNAYYEVRLKEDRLSQLMCESRFRFFKVDLADRGRLASLFQTEGFQKVVNLAAQAGVRYSMINPDAYVESNLVGFANVLEGCRQTGVKYLIFASSSSVYGANTHMPFSVHDNVDHPVSLYAATKKSNELLAHAYAHLYGLPCTGLRFFTVYGPWGRPDMAYFSFTRAILEGRAIQVYNHGKLRRDFTYVDDIIEGLVRLMDKVPEPNPNWTGERPDPGTAKAPYRIYNIGNNDPVEVMALIQVLEAKLGLKAKLEYLPMQPGDVPATYADVNDLVRDVGFRPGTPIEEGIGKFVDWYKEYYQWTVDSTS
jgi:UDP-glucuronate 4-epimerase